MATFGVGGSGVYTKFKSPVYIGKLDAGTYPSGTITFSNVTSGGAYWRHNSSVAQTYRLYLTNANNTIWSPYILQISWSTNGTSTVNSGTVHWPNRSIVGQNLYLVAYMLKNGNYSTIADDYFELHNYTTISLGVKTAPTVSAGTLITKTQMDNLKTFLNKGTTVTQYDTITAAVGNSYRSGTVTSGVTTIDDAWYNNA